MVNTITTNMAMTLTVVEIIAVAIFIWKASSNYSKTTSQVNNCQNSIMKEIVFLEERLEARIDGVENKFRYVDRYLKKTQSDYTSSDFD